MDSDSKDFSLKQIFPFNVNAAILLAVFTAFAYACSYIYERSYCINFKIPSELISIDLSVLLPFWIITTIVVIISVFTLVLGYTTISRFKQKQKLYTFLKYNLILILSLGVSWYLHPDFAKLHKEFYYIGFSIFNILLIVVLIASKKRQDDQESNLDSEPSGNRTDLKVLANNLQSAINSFLIIIVVVTGMMSDEAGASAAKKRVNFYVLSDNNNMVVIRIYGEKVICKELDATRKRLTDKIMVIKNDAEHPLKLEEKHLGILAY
ncbi:MAG TPA: hypothetical protein VL442_19090 [Mucilaginibacter sp.]|jgi:CDP-diglyceride synthetase|nr:hypothetical protein [Mucilaginibacter sp.]